VAPERSVLNDIVAVILSVLERKPSKDRRNHAASRRRRAVPTTVTEGTS
jgi:hypothetical protein